ncbi:hypothetical protein GETHOR_29040 [Geothrix oryzae]|jgi:ABC-type uncharacterized transport system substrate-binding protein|uniref:Uncharacterized protein n=1 Tax=Geothrix oryzae TaxID=2927975 RepID=A0ABN6V0F2_9BACT|nr:MULTISPECIES: hypothetical protein [Geothrix]BDU70803.1 hypothetical protein GETHOR_29040 [Geothrix oryzae]
MKLVTLLSAAALMTASLSAGDYDALGKAMRSTWPQMSTVAVVCDSAHSKGAVDAISGAMTGMKIIVIDVKGPQDMGKALGTLGGRRPDAVVLVAGDKVAGDGTSAASFLIQRMAASKVPTLATTEAGVRQGAVLGVGPGTGGKLLGNAKVAGVAGVSLPANASQI